MIRGWAPTVPKSWSTESLVAVDLAAEAAVFRGLAISTPAGGPARLYATDFHNGKVVVFDARWKRIERPGAFQDPDVSPFYEPYNVLVAGERVFVTYASKAPVNGNDSPHGGYVDEFDLDGRLLGRVAHGGPLNAPWGLAVAPEGFGRYGGDLLVGNFGDGHVNAFERRDGRWRFRGPLLGGDGKPLVIDGLWGLAFGNDGMAGPKGTLFFAAGPHSGSTAARSTSTAWWGRSSPSAEPGNFAVNNGFSPPLELHRGNDELAREPALAQLHVERAVPPRRLQGGPPGGAPGDPGLGRHRRPRRHHAAAGHLSPAE